MKKVLVTGASGFIGQYLCRALVDSGYEVHGLYEHKKSFKKNPELEHKHLVNLLDFSQIDKLVETVQPDYVIHLAAKTEVALSFDNYLEVSQVNYVGTVNLAEANRKNNPHLKLFLMASTMETYGHQDEANGAFTESTLQKPAAPYSVAKMACEKYLEYLDYAYQFPFCVLRQTNAYGRTDNDFFVMERIISQMVAGDICSLGEPSPVRNFIWIDDLVGLYLTILEKYQKARGEVFLTGPPNGITISELVHLIRKKLDWRGTVKWHTIPLRPGEVYYLNSVHAKAEKVLGWQPVVTLSEGIDKLIALKREQK